ncbi:MAG: hypothetical protein D9V47_02265 [Clostridia bacterium]|nr:MAG: hypothetical protein D9V47_02265 [Clostridia bacterium]
MELLIFILFILFMFARAVAQQQRKQAGRRQRQGPERRPAPHPESPEDARPWWWDEPLPPPWPQMPEPQPDPGRFEPEPVAGPISPEPESIQAVIAAAPGEEPETYPGAGQGRQAPGEALPGPLFLPPGRAAFGPLSRRELRQAVVLAEILAPPLARRGPGRRTFGADAARYVYPRPVFPGYTPTPPPASSSEGVRTG